MAGASCSRRGSAGAAQERQRAQARQEVGGGRAEERRAHPVVAHEHPGRQQRADRSTQRVEGVEVPDGPRGPLGLVHQRAHQERQRHPHQERRRRQERELHERRARQRIEPGGQAEREHVVEQGAARRAPDGDADLDQRERDERAARRAPLAEHAARVAAEAEPHHERGHDDRDRVDPDAALQGEDALPDDLVDEGGGPAQEEENAGEEGARWQGDRILPAMGRRLGRRARSTYLQDCTQ